MNIKRDNGFTLIEVMAVIIIIAALASVAIPRFAASIVSARQKADVATAHQVKSALDRYQIENGVYPTAGDGVVDGEGEISIDSGNDGNVVCTNLIPKYISKLDASTTQQNVDAGEKGFGLDTLDPDDYSIPDLVEPAAATNIIMIYLSTDGLAAEVRAYDETLKEVLWTSAN